MLRRITSYLRNLWKKPDFDRNAHLGVLKELGYHIDEEIHTDNDNVNDLYIDFCLKEKWYDAPNLAVLLLIRWGYDGK